MRAHCPRHALEAGVHGSSNALTARWASTIDDASTVLSGAGVVPLLALLAAAAQGSARDELSAVVGSASAPDLMSALAGSPTTRAAMATWARPEPPPTDWRL